jgi:hypothetical protein
VNQKTENRESSVAWFRLAELISHGEKEKALSFYRLLAHSFEDCAYSLQVEGDILWSFEDKCALEKYKQAAFLYCKEQKITAAVSIYEHLFVLQVYNFEVLQYLISSYMKLDWFEKLEDRFDVASKWFLENKITADQLWAIVQCMIDALAEGKDKGKQFHECSVKKVVKLIYDKVPAVKEKTMRYVLDRELKV